MISVIIPTINEAARIGGLLQSLQPMRQQGHEIIVVDGGSEDDSIAIATPLADRVLQRPMGRAKQMNAGAALAKGNTLWFLHADSQITASLWEQLAVAAQKHSAWGWFNVQISGDHFLLPLVAKMMNLRARLTSVSTGDMGQFVSRELYERVGGFGPLFLMEDINISKRLRKLRTATILLGPMLVSGRRWQQHGVIRTILFMWWLRLMYWIGMPTSRLAKCYGQ